MALQIWRPDTCRCVIEQMHDPTNPAVEIGLSRVIRKCSAHETLTDAEVWETVWAYPSGENRRKNLMRNRIVEQHGTEPGWLFTGQGKDRVLHLSVPGLSVAARNALRGFAQQTVKSDRVEFVDILPEQ
jgi:hypothetical protein